MFVHNVGAFEVYQMNYRAVVERHIVVDKLHESRQLFLVGEPSAEDKVCNLLETEAFLLEQGRYEVVELISTVVEFALRGVRLTVLTHLVTYHIAYVSQTYEHAGAVFVAQATLHSVLRKQVVLNLAGRLYCITQLIYQILFLHILAFVVTLWFLKTLD